MPIEEDFWAELAQIQAESIGWIPLDEGAYLHVGSDALVIQVVWHSPNSVDKYYCQNLNGRNANAKSQIHS